MNFTTWNEENEAREIEQEPRLCFRRTNEG